MGISTLRKKSFHIVKFTAFDEVGLVRSRQKYKEKGKPWEKHNVSQGSYGGRIRNVAKGEEKSGATAQTPSKK